MKNEINKNNDDVNNPFFFFLRAKKKLKNINDKASKDMESINLFRSSLHNKPFLNKKKSGLLKKRKSEPKKIKRIIKRTPRVGETFRDQFTYYFGNDSHNFFHGMKKHEWMHILNQYELYKKDYEDKKDFIENELYKRKEKNRTEKSSQILPELSKRDFEFHLLNKEHSFISKMRSMPNILSRLNREQKINFEHNIVIGKANQNDYSNIKSFTLFNLFDIENFYIFGVLVGKGLQSILMARIIKETLIRELSNKKTYKIKSMIVSEDDVYSALTDNSFELIKSFSTLIPILIKENGYNVEQSGAIVNLTIIIKNKVIFANLGTIRTYLLSKKLNEDDNLYSENIEIKPIDNIHSTRNIYEQDRIENCGGEVIEEGNQVKISGKHKGIDDNDITYTRILGYKKLNTLGISNEIQIQMEDINKEKQCIVVGTNYFWDCFDIKYYSKVINWFIAGKKGDAFTISQYLMELSKTKAKERFNTFYERCLLLIIFK